MRTVLLLAAVLSMGQAPADPPKVTVIDDPPAAKWVEVKAKLGRPITLKADKPVHWFLIDDTLATLLTDTGKTSDTARVVPYAGGCFRLLGYDPADPFTPARLMVTVEGPQPMPPTPPGPQPPPGPGPQPLPVDAFTAKVQEAFKTDTPADLAQRIDAAKDLAAFWGVASGYAQNSDATKLSELVTLVGTTSGQMVKGRLPGCRAAFKAELARLFPNELDLTPDVRNQLEALFLKFQAAAKTLPDLK